jgi:uncharacterized protein (DUF1330 family)
VRQGCEHACHYFIASYDITDPERYERDYVPGVELTVAAAGGEVVVASGSTRRLEGGAPGQTVVFRFPAERAFRSWYEWDEYAPFRRARLETTTNGTGVLATEFQKAAMARKWCENLPPGSADGSWRAVDPR